MNKTLIALAALMTLCRPLVADEVKYEFAPDFIQSPPGKEKLGNSHGEVAVDSTGNIYVSVQEKGAGLLVYGPEGKFIKSLPVPDSLHGFVIRKNDEGEFIYAAVLNEQRFIKCNLDGTVVLEIKIDAFPEAQRTAKGGLKLTGCDLAPNGDIYVVDGYGKSWIFQFDKTGAFKKVFGGPPQIVDGKGFANTHKIFIDHRFTPARIVALDRGNNRMFHLDLDGNFIAMIAKEGLRNPSSASFNGDLMCVAEIAGRVSVWDKDNKMVASLGVNDTKGQTNTPKVGPQDWKQGTVTSPHGITFDAQGNILETEWNQWGRVLRWNKK